MEKGTVYLVAGCAVLSTFPLDGFEDFRRGGESAAVPAVRMDRRETAFPPLAADGRDHGELWVARLPEGGWLFRPSGQEPLTELKISAAYDRMTLLLRPGTEEAAAKRQYLPLIRFALCCRLLHDCVLTLHAACVTLDGQAVAFTGASGIGKSTRARAWEQALHASWLSGDRPAVSVGAGGLMACGVPWDGKEQVFRSAEYPLRAVAEVRRSKKTTVRRLDGKQAQRVVSRQCFLPLWDAAASFAAMESVLSLAQSGRVYRLFCGPGEKAAREAYGILFQHPEEIREVRPDMKIREGFILRSVMGESIVMPTGENMVDFDGAVVLNDVSAFVFERLKLPICREDLLQAVLEEFDVDEATAGADLDALLERFRALSMLDEEPSLR